VDWQGIKLLTAALLMMLQFNAVGWAQAQEPTPLAELAAYAGRDREQRLIAGAKAEGKVVWYTSLAEALTKSSLKGSRRSIPASG
jgi:hypothetical protein